MKAEDQRVVHYHKGGRDTTCAIGSCPTEPEHYHTSDGRARWGPPPEGCYWTTPALEAFRAAQDTEYAERVSVVVGRSPMEDEIVTTADMNKARAALIDKIREECDRNILGGTAKTDAPNPKDLLGVAKTPTLSLVPTTALILMGEAMRNGAEKYGAFNWRQHSVQASIYVDAAMRHLMAWWDSEQQAEDSGCHHLGHALACLGILVDAEELDKLIDDRPGARAGDTPEVGPSPLLLKRYKRDDSPSEEGPWHR